MVVKYGALAMKSVGIKPTYATTFCALATIDLAIYTIKRLGDYFGFTEIAKICKKKGNYEALKSGFLKKGVIAAFMTVLSGVATYNNPYFTKMWLGVFILACRHFRICTYIYSFLVRKAFQVQNFLNKFLDEMQFFLSRLKRAYKFHRTEEFLKVYFLEKGFSQLMFALSLCLIGYRLQKVLR